MTAPANSSRLRRPAWRAAPAPAVAIEDDGPRRLRVVAANAAQRARAVLLARVTATCSEPQRTRYTCDPGTDRVWLRDSGRTSCWCVLTERSQRALLEHVLAGPGAATPTAVERTIVAECVSRLLASSPDDAWSESAKMLPHSDAWHCGVDIGGANGKRAILLLYTIAEPQRAAGGSVVLDDIPIDLVAELDGVNVPLSQLTRWARGSIVPLGRPPSELHATLALTRGTRMPCFVGESGGRRAVSLRGLHGPPPR